MQIQAGCTAWLVGSRCKALLSVLPVRFAALRYCALSSNILIVDAVHEMGDPYMAVQLRNLLAAHWAALQSC